MVFTNCFSNPGNCPLIIWTQATTGRHHVKQLFDIDLQTVVHI